MDYRYNRHDWQELQDTKEGVLSMWITTARTAEYVIINNALTRINDNWNTDANVIRTNAQILKGQNDAAS